MQSKNDNKKLRSDAIRAAFTARDHRLSRITLGIALAIGFTATATPVASIAAEPPVQQTVVVPIHPLLYALHAPELSLQEKVVVEAKKYIGTPYVPYEADPAIGFDCSGFTMYVYGKLGIKLPHSASAQLAGGIPVTEAEAVPGDLVKMFGHVGIWMGHGMMLDSPRTGKTVGIRPIWAKHYTIFKVRT